MYLIFYILKSQEKYAALVFSQAFLKQIENLRQIKCILSVEYMFKFVIQILGPKFSLFSLLLYLTIHVFEMSTHKYVGTYLKSPLLFPISAKVGTTV